MKSPYIMLLISAAAASDCCIDQNSDRSCNYSDECMGDDYCRASQSCGGFSDCLSDSRWGCEVSNCIPDSCTPTTAVELLDRFTAEIVINSQTPLGGRLEYYNGIHRNRGTCLFADPNYMVYNTDEYMVITAERTNATQGNDCLEWI